MSDGGFGSSPLFPCVFGSELLLWSWWVDLKGGEAYDFNLYRGMIL